MNKILLIILFFSSFLFANKNFLVIDEKQIHYNNFQILYYQDNTNKLQIEDIIKKEFKNKIPNKYSFAYPKGKIWIKIDLLNKTFEDTFILNLNESIYEKANLYYYEDEKLIKKLNGIEQDIEKREIKRKEIAYLINIEKGQEKSFYIELEGTLSNIINLSISTNKYYLDKSFLESNNFIVFSLGIIVFIILFNLFLYFNLKEKIYIYYVIYVFSTFMIILNSSGFFIYLGLNDFIYEIQAFSALGFLFFNFFSMEFFDTKKSFPKIHTVLKTSALIFIPLGILSLFYHNPWILLKNIHIGLDIYLLLGCSIYIYLKQKNRIKYYIFALFFYVTFMFLTQLMILGLIEYNFITRYAFIIAIVVENIIFSLLLANRYNELKNESINTQRELIKIKSENEVYLQDEVTKQTKQLKDLALEKELLLKEVVHRVKNNFHTIIGAIWFESRKEKIDKQNFIELINRVQSMSHIHEFLYNEKDVSNIEVINYIKTLVGSIVSTYDSKKIKSSFKLDKDIFLELEYAASLGIIVNEVITNIIKHNQKKDDIFIHTSLKEVDGKVVMSIRNNGSEFDISNTRKGLGLKLIKDFSKNLLSCEYDYLFEDNVTFKLSFLKSENG